MFFKRTKIRKLEAKINALEERLCQYKDFEPLIQVDVKSGSIVAHTGANCFSLPVVCFKNVERSDTSIMFRVKPVFPQGQGGF